MSESALERIKRLKLEREAAAKAEVQVEKKEEEKENVASSGNTTVTGSSAVSSPAGDVAAEVVQDQKVPAQPVEEPKKELSAMERLRQLKMGGAAPAQQTPVQAPAPVVEQKIEEKKVEKPKLPTATHPIAMEMAELEAALNEEVPGFVSILSTIHKKLRQDPDVVTLLSEEEIAVIVSGLEKHTQIVIVAPNAVKAAKKAAKTPVTADDL